MLLHINTVKALADQLRSIEVNITDVDVYMVLLVENQRRDVENQRRDCTFKST